MSFIQLKDVRKRYGDKVVLDGINLEIERNEFIAIVGPYGSGKTTLFKILSGLTNSFEGQATLNGALPTDALRNRRIGYCFQRPSLLPWRNVQDNLTLPLDIVNQVDPARTRKLLQLGGLEDYASYQVNQLSGGMQQILCILRALMLSPDILLLDEPFSAIDELSREKFQTMLTDIHAETKKTTLMITHSIQEAVWLADRVVVLSDKPAVIKKVFKIPNDCHTDRYGVAFNKKILAIRKCLSDA